MKTKSIIITLGLALVLGATAILLSTIAYSAPKSGSEDGSREAYDFRVLGHIEANCRQRDGGSSSWTTLQTQDAEHARMTASKLVADLKAFGDIKASEGPATALALDKAGSWIIGLDGAKVQILFAKNPADLKAMSRERESSAWQAVPERAYPRWLDRFDNDAVSFGYMGWAQNRADKDINESAKWIGDHKFAMDVEIGSHFHPMVAPGLFDDSMVDYYAALAKRYQVPFTPYTFGFSPLRPAYLWNKFPLPHFLPAPGFKALSTDSNVQRHVSNESFVNGAVTDDATASADMGFTSLLMANELCNVNQGTMELGGSFPLLLSSVGGTPGIKKDWMTFLKETRGYSLEDVGRIYHGNPSFYKTWEEIPITAILDFTGWEQGKCLDLRGEWLGRPDLKKEGLGKNRFASEIPSEGWGALLPGATMGGYRLTDVAGSVTGNPFGYHEWAEIPVEGMSKFTGWDAATCQDLRGKHDRSKYAQEPTWFDKDIPTRDNWAKIQQDDSRILAYSEGDFWLRRDFTVNDNSLETQRYLHVARTAYHGKGPRPEIYVNGQPVRELNGGADSMQGNFDLCYDLKGRLVPGKNQIAMRLPGGPPINYIFLSSKGWWSYPSDDVKLNRQYFDMVEFAARLIAKNTEWLVRSRRAGDPSGRPQYLMAAHPIQDLLFDVQKRYGAYSHCTGQSGACWAPWVTRYSATRGQPISSEVGSAPLGAAEIQKQLTLYELLGNDCIHFLFHPTQYRKPDIAAWIDSNMALFHCAGKADRPAPSLGVLRSLRNSARLGFEAPWSWDISRGEAQAVGRSIDMADPCDLVSGNASKWFKFLFDAATELFTKEEIAGLDHFVREGGIFVALHNTGRQTPDQKDSWPISDLTGLKVVTQNETHGKIRFSETQTLWPSLRGKEIDGWGIALNWAKQNDNAPALGMESTSEDVEVVAEWVGRKPGEGRIAIATRRLGKGMIVTLGSSFWRKAQDTGGCWKPDAKYRPYLAELFDSLKIPYDSRRDLKDASNADVFAEHFLSKNGVYDLYLMARVNEKAPPAKASMVYKAAQQPLWLREFSAKGHPEMPFAMEPDGIKISNADLGPMQLRIFAAPRHDIAQSTMTWLQSLHKRWDALEPLPKSEIPAPPETSPAIMPLVTGWSLASGNARWGIEPPSGADAATGWSKGRTVKLGTYAALGLEETALAQFHKSVKIPDSWAGRRIFLRFAANGVASGIHYKHRLWINGKLSDPRYTLGTESKFSQELTDLKPGSTLTLDLEVDGAVEGKVNRSCPSGVAGVFFLESVPTPVASQPLVNWIASEGVGLKEVPVAHAAGVDPAYFETHFQLPEKWPTPRLFIESPTHLGWLILNGQMLSTPGWMNRLDISGMVKKDGSGNVLYWVPSMFEPMRFGSYRIPQPVSPQLNLAWMPEGDEITKK